MALSVGRLTPDKGHIYGIRACESLVAAIPSFHWTILGEGPLRSELEAEADRLNLGSHIHFLGYVADPLPWYVAADLYLRTNVVEGDNLSSFQAMAAGLPVVGFDTGSETDLVPVAGHGVLVANRGALALAEAVRTLLTQDRGRELGRLGADFARAHLATERIVASCESLYRDLLLGSANRDQ